jgi:hypothetical protein
MPPTLMDSPFPTYAQSDSDGIASAIREDGFAIIPEVLAKSEVEELKSTIDSIISTPGPGDGVGLGKGIDHFKCVFNRDPYWLQFLDKSGIIEAVEDLMGKDSHIIGMSAWRSPPGTGSFGQLHTDQLFVPMDEELLTTGKVELPVFISTLHFYLNDMDEDLCPTWIVPGSHKSGRSPGGKGATASGVQGGEEMSWNGEEARPVLVKAGDAMLFRSEVWHSGSVNRTEDRTRYLLQVHYSRRGIAQRFPPYLEFKYNQKVLDSASERQLRLLGKHNIGAYG